jgi:hypothetical protein
LRIGFNCGKGSLTGVAATATGGARAASNKNVENNPMHSSGDIESICHFRSVPGRPFSDVVERKRPTEIPVARRIASSGFDTSGKTLA